MNWNQRLVSLAIILTQWSGSAAWASESPQAAAATGDRQIYLDTLASLNSENGGFLRSLRKKSPGSPQKDSLIKRTASSSAEVGRTFVLMEVLAGVEIVKEEYLRAKTEGRPMDRKAIERTALIASEKLVTGGGIWMSLLGSHVIEKSAHVPIQILQKLAQSSGSRGILIKLLSSGIISFISFTGWEAGSQLWEEATLLIEDESDYNRSKNLALLLAEAPVNSESRRVLGKVISNAKDILLGDDALRTEWIYNTWRLRIATGNFVTMVSAMTTASVIGTEIYPGAGTLAGMMFAAVGGLTASLIPEKANNAITAGLRVGRRFIDRVRLNVNATSIRSDIDGLNFIISLKPTQLKEALDLIASRKDIREDIATTYFETDFQIRASILNFDHESKTIQETLQRGLKFTTTQSDLVALLNKRKRQIEELKKELQRIEVKFMDIYSNELDSLADIESYASKNKAPEQILSALADSSANAAILERFFAQMRMDGVDFKNKDVLKLVQKVHLLGLKEEWIVSRWIKKNE